MGADRPKQYLTLGGKTILARTLDKLQQLNPARLVVAISPEDPYFDATLYPGVERVDGGNTRVDSVLAGLERLDLREQDWVMVHDAVRPCVSIADVRRLLEGIADDPIGGLLAVPVMDTLKRVQKGRVRETLDRSELWLAQTPQVFRFGPLVEALQSLPGATDEASAIEAMGHKPHIVLGRSDNLKITVHEDLALAAFIVAREGT